ncbi:uncharacterized mitochondrial protein-like protein [Tanacetum coccineum]
MDVNGVVIKNKASLVSQWYNQQEGIDYEETFAPIARLEAIMILLAYASYMSFMVYLMDVKSAFLNGKISEEVASVKYPMLLPNNLGLDESGVSVNETLLRGMIGSVMYLTASRPDIQFPHVFVLGLWYLKGSGFDVKAYYDPDYAGCNLERKSTFGGYQILGGKLVCWSAKKQSSVVMSSAKAEYVAAARKGYIKNDNLMSLKPHHITATTFKPTLENEIALTTHICKVAELSPDPIKSLIPPSGEVNTDDSANKSSSRTSVQPVIQSKASTDLKIKKKRIPPSSKPKSSKQVRDVPPKKQVTDTQPAEETVATVDAT